MIYLELGGILETKLCASCNQSGHFFVNSSRAECFARFYASEKEAVIVATRAHKFSARFITPLLRLRLLKYNYAENPKATEEALWFRTKLLFEEFCLWPTLKE